MIKFGLQGTEPENLFSLTWLTIYIGQLVQPWQHVNLQCLAAREEKRYTSAIPIATPMLTSDHKSIKNEAAFDLFRNKV